MIDKHEQRYGHIGSVIVLAVACVFWGRAVEAPQSPASIFLFVLVTLSGLVGIGDMLLARMSARVEWQVGLSFARWIGIGVVFVTALLSAFSLIGPLLLIPAGVLLCAAAVDADRSHGTGIWVGIGTAILAFGATLGMVLIVSSSH